MKASFTVFLVLLMVTIASFSAPQEIANFGIRLNRIAQEIQDWFRGGSTRTKPPLLPEDNKAQKQLAQQVLRQRYTVMLNQGGSVSASSQDDPDARQMIEEALASLDHDPDELERELAVMTLGDYTTEQARTGLLSALDDRSALVRDQAVSQIIEWADPDQRSQMILAGLNNQRTEVVMHILESITEVSDPALIHRLTRLSRHSNREIKESAQLALELADR